MVQLCSMQNSTTAITLKIYNENSKCGINQKPVSLFRLIPVPHSQTQDFLAKNMLIELFSKIFINLLRKLS